MVFYVHGNSSYKVDLNQNIPELGLITMTRTAGMIITIISVLIVIDLGLKNTGGQIFRRGR
jgi:hypothetical protein